MRRLHVRLAAACAFAAAMAIFMSGAAFAGGNGNGNGNGNGHDGGGSSGTPAAQTQSSSGDHGNGNGRDQSSQPAPSQQPSTQQPATQQPQQQQPASQQGVKPSNSTTHWTHCQTGTSSSGATCTSSDNGHTPQSGSDVSKRYGNGKTAAQIATSRGGVGVQLTGPGNSQPHKVSDCSHKSNKSGGVDVHAVKSYSTSGCESTSSEQPSTQKPEQHGQKPEEHKKPEDHHQPTTPVAPVHQPEFHVTICHATGTPDTAGNGYVLISPSVSGVYHGHYRQHGADIIPPFTYEGQTYSANWTASGQAIFNNGCRPLAAVVPTTKAQTLTTTTTVPSTTTTTIPSTTTVPSTTTTTVQATTTVTTTTQSTTTVGAVAGTTTTVQQHVAPSTTTTASSAGGVLGAHTSLTPKPASHKGVLGTATHVAGGTLPFTGFPVWLAVLIALALILAGFALRRRALGPRGL